MTDTPTPLTEPAGGVPPVLTSADEFADTARRLAGGTGPIAVDTERASGYRYSQRAYLIQLKRTGAGSFLLDPTLDPEALTPVIDVLTGPEWVLHAADQDLPCLREVGFVCSELFDTELAGRLLGRPKVNLATMVEEFLGLGLSKGHGAADWSRRPLPHDWLVYAALDVEVLVELREATAAALTEAGKGEWAHEEFAAILNRPTPPARVDRWRRTTGIHTVKSARALAAVRELWLAREEVARRRDIAPGRILPDSAIVTAATADPATIRDLTRLPVFGGPRQSRNARTWFDALERARALPTAELPPRTPPSTGLPAYNRWDRSNPEGAERAAVIRPLLGALAEENELPPENLLAPDVVRTLCWEGVDLPATPESVDARLADAGARSWQRYVVSGAIAEALNTAGDAPDSAPTADA